MLVRDLLDLFAGMEDRRRPMEAHWRAVEQVVPPITRQSLISGGIPETLNKTATRRKESAVKRYDSTMMTASARLATGLYSLIVPESEKWHTLSTATIEDIEDDEERRWAERLRDVLFFNRYSPKARFQPSVQSALLSTVYYGPSYIYIEPSFSQSTAMRYQYLPVDECFILRDDFGSIVGFAQRKMVKARDAAARKWKLTGTVASDANDPKRKLTEHRFIKIVIPREEVGFRKYRTKRNTPWVCYTINEDAQEIVYEEGFETFPVACFFWDDMLGDYGTSPCIDYLLEQRMLNGMERDVLMALHQIVRPPLGVHDDSLTNRPNLNPGAVNPGAVSADGKPLMVPLLQGQNPERAVPFIEQRREHLRDGFYNTLFQSLVEQPGQTATEVLTRANEKSQLLSPVGARMHSGLDMMIEREIEALEIRGLYAPNSPLLPPESLADKDIRPKYTNPMSRLQMAGQAEGVMRMMEMDAVRIQQGKPALVKDAETGEFLAQAFNAPLNLIKTKDELAEEEAANREMAQERQAVESTRQLAAASKDALPAMEAAGLVQPQ